VVHPRLGERGLDLPFEELRHYADVDRFNVLGAATYGLEELIELHFVDVQLRVRISVFFFRP
jgi:hypothetical protein